MHEEKTDVCFVKITLAALPISLPTIKLFESHTHTHTFRLFNIEDEKWAFSYGKIRPVEMIFLLFLPPILLTRPRGTFWTPEL